jgi:hypothetical protein
MKVTTLDIDVAQNIFQLHRRCDNSGRDLPAVWPRPQPADGWSQRFWQFSPQLGASGRKA